MRAHSEQAVVLLVHRKSSARHCAAEVILGHVVLNRAQQDIHHRLRDGNQLKSSVSFALAREGGPSPGRCGTSSTRQAKGLPVLRGHRLASNAISRIEDAMRMQQKNGLEGFSSVSDQMSLAEMVNPVYPDAISFGNSVARAWLTEKPIPLFPWSSQARGFFLDQKDSGTAEGFR